MEGALTTISMAVIPQGVGRKPLDAQSATRTTTVRLTQAVRDRVTKLVGEKGLAAFMRVAIDAELKRREAKAQPKPAAAAPKRPASAAGRAKRKGTQSDE